MIYNLAIYSQKMTGSPLFSIFSPSLNKLPCFLLRVFLYLLAFLCFKKLIRNILTKSAVNVMLEGKKTSLGIEVFFVCVSLKR